MTEIMPKVCKSSFSPLLASSTVLIYYYRLLFSNNHLTPYYDQKHVLPPNELHLYKYVKHLVSFSLKSFSLNARQL